MSNILTYLPTSKQDDRPDFNLIAFAGDWSLFPPLERDRPWTAIELRIIADALRYIAGRLHVRANGLRGEAPDEVLADVQVFASGKVRRWVSDRIETEEQKEWLRELLPSEPDAASNRT